MSAHAAFRRQPVPGQFAQNLKAITLPAPTRGIIQHENEAYTGPGSCIISDNWFPTLKGVRLRGGSIRWCDLHALDTVVPPVPDPARLPVISAFEYVGFGDAQRMFAAQATKLFDVTGSMPVLVKGGCNSGNWCAVQLANQATYWLIATNDYGDPVLRFNGTTWSTLDPVAVTAWANNTVYAIGALARDTFDSTAWCCLAAHTSPASGTFAADRTASPGRWAKTAADGSSWITGPVGSAVEFGRNLSYVAKYRNRLFFIQTNSMNVWYLEPDAVGGELKQIAMSGAASRGGYLLFLANWSVDAGDGIDDKLVVLTSEGEALIWTGNNPSDAANWRQEGRYFVGRPLGMNAHAAVGGDVLILTVEGIVPLSQTITKSSGEMELAMVSRAIRRMWREEVAVKTVFPWTIKRWDEFGGVFITFPGGAPGNRYCLGMNSATGAFARAVGWDALCFIKLRENMFFGTQDGLIMQMDRTGYDDGNHAKIPYVATLIGGWEMFQARSQTVVWHQARAVFTSGPSEPFVPQLDATVDYVVTVPPPPPAGDDPGVSDVWDQGRWGPDMGGPPPPVPTDPQRLQYAQWDQPTLARPVNRNTLWVSIGKTGFSHAPIVQVTVAQAARPVVELIAIAATFEQAGVNV